MIATDKKVKIAPGDRDAVQARHKSGIAHRLIAGRGAGQCDAHPFADQGHGGHRILGKGEARAAGWQAQVVEKLMPPRTMQPHIDQPVVQKISGVLI